jgi:hypothetical protein
MMWLVPAIEKFEKDRVTEVAEKAHLPTPPTRVAAITRWPQ